jgi:hypothetical protein
MPIDKQQASILENLDDGVDTFNEPMEETTNTRGQMGRKNTQPPRYDNFGEAMTGIASNITGIASGAVSATLGLPTDIVGLMKGLKDASSAEDGKRLDAFSEGFTEFSKENLGSQYYRDVFDTFVDSLDVDPRLKEDAKSGFSAGEFLGAPVSGGAAVKTVSKIDKIKESLSRAEASASTMKKNARDKIKTFRKEFDNKAPETYTKDEIIAMAAKREPSPVRQLKSETIEQFKFPINQSSFLLDGDTVTIYHGTSKSTLPNILKSGLKGDKEGKVYTSPDVHSATGYGSVVGGEKANIRARRPKQNIDNENRLTLKYEIPKEDFLKLIGDAEKTQRSISSRMKLFREDSKNLFEKTKDNPQFYSKGKPQMRSGNYYEGTEIRFNEGDIDKYLVGTVQRVSKKDASKFNDAPKFKRGGLMTRT